MGDINKITGEALIRHADLCGRDAEITFADAGPFQRDLVQTVSRILFLVIQNGAAVRQFVLIAQRLIIALRKQDSRVEMFKMAEGICPEPVACIIGIKPEQAV